MAVLAMPVSDSSERPTHQSDITERIAPMTSLKSGCSRKLIGLGFAVENASQSAVAGFARAKIAIAIMRPHNTFVKRYPRGMRVIVLLANGVG